MKIWGGAGRWLAMGIAVAAIVVICGIFIPPGRLSAAAELFGALVLAVGSFLGWRQLSEMRAARVAEARPYVVAYLRIHERATVLLEFVVANLGRTMAKNIEFAFTPGLREPGAPLSVFGDLRWKALDEGLPSLAPGQELSCLWTNSISAFGADSTVTARHDICVNYEGEGAIAGHFSSDYVLDANQFFGITSVTTKGLHEGVKALEEVSQSLRGWTEGDGVRVYTDGLLEARGRREKALRDAVEPMRQRETAAVSGTDSRSQ